MMKTQKRKCSHLSPATSECEGLKWAGSHLQHHKEPQHRTDCYQIHQNTSFAAHPQPSRDCEATFCEEGHLLSMN